MKKCLISIIIPVCIYNNTINQNYNIICDNEYEVLVGDDKSTEKSASLLKKFCNNSHRFKYISGNGKGAGAARNIGLKYAKGEYIAFIDSDDGFSSELVLKCYKKMQHDNSDVCIFGGYEFDDLTGEIYLNTPIFRKQFLPNDSIFSFEDVKNCFFITSGAPWNKMYRKSFLKKHNNKFMEQKYFNDMYFTYSNLLCAKRVSVVDEQLYYYRVNNKNSLQGKKWDDISCLTKTLDKIKVFIEKAKLNNRENVRFSFISFVTSLILALAKEAPDESSYSILMEYLKNELKSVDIKVLNSYLIDDISQINMDYHSFRKQLLLTR